MNYIAICSKKFVFCYRVIDSKNERFPIGCYIYGKFGWQTHTVTNPSEGSSPGLTPYILPDFGSHSKSLGLGCLGVTGYQLRKQTEFSEIFQL